MECSLPRFPRLFVPCLCLLSLFLVQDSLQQRQASSREIEVRKPFIYCHMDIKSINIQKRIKHCTYIVLTGVQVVDGKVKNNPSPDHQMTISNMKKGSPHVKFYLSLHVKYYEGFLRTTIFSTIRPLLEFFEGFVWISPVEKQMETDPLSVLVKEYCDANKKKLIFYNHNRRTIKNKDNCKKFTKNFHGIILEDIYGNELWSSMHKNIQKSYIDDQEDIIKTWVKCGFALNTMIQEVTYENTEMAHKLRSEAQKVKGVKISSWQWEGNMDQDELFQIGVSVKKGKLGGFYVPLKPMADIVTDGVSSALFKIAVPELAKGYSNFSEKRN